jgi:outer membrane lipopolysaccharide assembly protein LptE/RlpB
MVAGVVLFAVSYAADAILYSLNIPAAVTVTDNLAIGAAGAAVVLVFLFRHHEHEVVARAKERAIIVAEMNHHIRNAMTPLVLGVSSDDITERLRTLDQATDRVDHVLTDLLPTAGSATKPRYS